MVHLHLTIRFPPDRFLSLPFPNMIPRHLLNVAAVGGHNPRLYCDCGGPTSIPHTVKIFRRLSHCLSPNIFTWNTGISTID